MVDITVKANTVEMRDLLDDKFIEIMANIERAYTEGKEIIISPGEGFMIDSSIQILMDVIKENTAVFTILEQQGILSFIEPTLQ